MQRCVMLLLPVLLALGVQAWAQEPFPAGRYRLDPQHARIAWSVDHLGFSTYRGLIPGVGGTLQIDPAHPDAARLDVEVPMSRISTLDDALDRRLRGPQFFNTGRYPAASYHADGLVMTGARSATMQGSLTLCGVTHPVRMNVRFERAGADPVDGRLTLGFAGTATVRRSLFGVVAYTPLVGDDVGLDLEAEFIPDSAPPSH
jgi:polyisoprenoid-binding protein YceI